MNNGYQPLRGMAVAPIQHTGGRQQDNGERRRSSLGASGGDARKLQQLEDGTDPETRENVVEMGIT